MQRAASSSAARPSWPTCAEDEVSLELDGVRTPTSEIPYSEVIGADPIETTVVFRPRRTEPLDEDGQGDAHFAFAYAAHRAIVDVDVELGIVRVVEIATTQDVGRAVNPLAVEGQIAGGIAQGIGLALMEELVIAGGQLLNGSFTDYLLPTALDVPRIRFETLELGHPDAPYGLNGVGEPPTIASTAAIAAAVRDATGAGVTRVPIRPEHLVADAHRGLTVAGFNQLDREAAVELLVSCCASAGVGGERRRRASVRRRERRCWRQPSGSGRCGRMPSAWRRSRRTLRSEGWPPPAPASVTSRPEPRRPTGRRARPWPRSTRTTGSASDSSS